jgi:hypothetical protein
VEQGGLAGVAEAQEQDLGLILPEPDQRRQLVVEPVHQKHLQRRQRSYLCPILGRASKDIWFGGRTASAWASSIRSASYTTDLTSCISASAGMVKGIFPLFLSIIREFREHKNREIFKGTLGEDFFF